MKRSVSAAGPQTVTLKFTARAKRTLRRSRRAQLKVAVRFTAADGNVATRTTKVTLGADRNSVSVRPASCAIACEAGGFR